MKPEEEELTTSTEDLSLPLSLDKKVWLSLRSNCRARLLNAMLERSSGCVVAWLLPSNRSSFRPFAALVGCSAVQVDPPPAHLWPTCISTCPHISNHTVEHFRRIFRQKKCEIKLICDLSGSCHRWPVVLYRQSKPGLHICCVWTVTPARDMTLLIS